MLIAYTYRPYMTLYYSEAALGAIMMVHVTISQKKFVFAGHCM